MKCTATNQNEIRALHLKNRCHILAGVDVVLLRNSLHRCFQQLLALLGRSNPLCSWVDGSISNRRQRQLQLCYPTSSIVFVSVAMSFAISEQCQTYNVHGKHGVQLNGARVEVAKQGYKEDIFEVFRITCEMSHVFDHTTQQDHPEREEGPKDQLKVVLHGSSCLPKQPQHGDVVEEGPARQCRLEDCECAPGMPSVAREVITLANSLFSSRNC